ncbi:hypothetical protein [Mesorhizobium sp. KR1-2]|uniref:hypothetical protein n=1 Tax=Mesorhizobium sp. KR1-2 TaxID=3156609 RepID=UPI0032B41D64
MADFVAVLRKTLDGLTDPTPALRQKVYDKARATINAKLAAVNPPPPQAVVDRQKRALEDAIATLEKEYADHASPKVSSDPLQELESVFASIERQKSAPPKPIEPVRPQPARMEPPARQEPARPEPARREAAPVESRPTADAAPKPGIAARAEATKAAPAPAMDARPKTTPSTTPPSSSGDAAASAKGGFYPPAADDDDDDDDVMAVEAEGGSDKRRLIAIASAAVVGLAVVAGGGYAIWHGKQTGTEPSQQEAAAPAPKPAEPAPAEPAQAAGTQVAPEAAQPKQAASDTGTEQKFTQRLNADGSEVDAGSAGGTAAIGEGTSVAAATQPPQDAAPANPAQPADATAGTTAPASSGVPAAQPGVAVGQRAIFYEERTSVAQGSAEPGSIVWSIVQESPGGDLPPEPAIRAEATIPGKDLQLRMTIRRNADQTLPASHIIEVIFLTPEGFEGGGIENVLRVSMKGSEQEPGSPLIGIPAKIADGFFLIALTDGKPELEANMTLLRSQSWIDVPIIYKSGRRALFTMEKGIPGQKVFDEAIKAWQAASGNRNG